MHKTATFRKVRETKGAVLFKEVSASGTELEMNNPQTIIGSLYLRKAGMGDDRPNVIRVTVETE